MKHKSIDSALHNFGHSFATLINYIDGEHICDKLLAAAMAATDRKVRTDISEENRYRPQG